MLLPLLELSSPEECIFQKELKLRLGIQQPRLSKLTSKLVRAGWVTVKTPEDDRRKFLTITTAAGKKKLAALTAAPPAFPRRRDYYRRITAQVGQT